MSSTGLTQRSGSMQITRIERQQKNKARYSIYLDDTFWLGVDETVLMRFALHKGQEITSDQQTAIKEAEARAKVFTQALNYLSYGLRSSQEMADYLAKQRVQNPQDPDGKDIPIQTKVIHEVLGKLTDLGYLNDLVYAQSYVRTAANINRKGPIVIERELNLKGVPNADILTAMDEYSDSMLQENLTELGRKYIKRKQKLPPKRLKQQLQAYLLTKGYPQEDVAEVVAHLDMSASQDQETVSLDREALKQVKRRQRKYSGYELKQRVSQSLFQKGFAYDLIQDWLTAHEELFEHED
ncbi:recombination regulator RecX [Suicoccus acidiformans]|uniref:Regulatory protein RecX n=2 Tax=Suicoccus acidiformans TaxID=2036206 RepID=A0A347WID4_9LACT|nr:recombination regulator RecX [Suicoccus acidiformans]